MRAVGKGFWIGAGLGLFVALVQFVTAGVPAAQLIMEPLFYGVLGAVVVMPFTLLAWAYRKLSGTK